MANINLHEIYVSIQGESTHAGRVCVFIRLAGCNLDCVYCDSVEAAKGEGTPTDVDEIIDKVTRFNTPLVEITGGEPLTQSATDELIEKLIALRFETLVETNGTIDLNRFDRRAKYIVDIKTPGARASKTFLESNYDALAPHDEVKFVVTSKEDFDWAVDIVSQKKLDKRLSILFSPALGLVEPKELAQWIIDSGLKARLNMQIHKTIWGEDATGV